ncbi:hypothetical protein [Halorarius litoreus]|uniref:hypothetical protein n=1 Tax=Halorarius litoreus TaxID=2962676 RepID=UPI0020CE27AC|nr:hypothetical protein [Halorarius litoreus]
MPETIPDPAVRGRTIDLTTPRHAASPAETVTAAGDALETAPDAVELTLRTPLDHDHPGQYLYLPLLRQFDGNIEVEYEGQDETAHVSTVVVNPRSPR